MEPIFILLFGLCFGSFITCMSYRLPLEMDAVKKPSFCPSCNNTLAARDLIPLFSWLFSGGKCRHCKTKISVRYPLIEIITAASFLGIYSLHGLTLLSILLMLFAVALLIMIVTDLEHFIIPDQIHIALLPLGLIYHYIKGSEPFDVAGGFLMGMALGLLLHHGYRILRKKEGLGYGDVKFFAVAGLWLTPLPMVPFLFLSGVFGVVFGLLWRLLGKGEYFPFGPALAFALLICVLWPASGDSFWSIGQWIQTIL
jgi:prepilin signal peptidase PulO-like enzyme (type II secretory pathway)